MPVTWSDEKLILLYIAPVGVRTHDLPHTVASNMVKVSQALTHSATAADNYDVINYMYPGNKTFFSKALKR